MGQLFSTNSNQSETTENQNEQSGFQRFIDSARKSLRIKHMNSPTESGVTRPVELQAQAQKSTLRTPLPESFRQSSTTESPKEAAPSNVRAAGSPQQSTSFLQPDRSAPKASTREFTPVQPVITPPVQSPPKAPTNESKTVPPAESSSVKTLSKAPTMESAPHGTPAATPGSNPPVQPVILEGVKSTIEQNLPSTQVNQQRARMMMRTIVDDPPMEHRDLKSNAEHQSKELEASQMLDVIISRAKERKTERAEEAQVVASTIAPSFKVPEHHSKKEMEPPKASAMLDVLTMDDDDPESPTNYKSMDLSHKSAFGSSKAETTDKAHHREPKSTEERNELISTLVESIKQKDSEMRLSSAENNDHNLCVIQPGVITKKADKEPPTVNELESVLTNAIIQKNHEAQEQKELAATLASAISKQEKKSVISENVKSTIEQSLPSTQVNQQRARMMMRTIVDDPPMEHRDLKSNAEHQSQETEASQMLDVIISRANERKTERAEEDQVVASTTVPSFQVPEHHFKKETEPPKTSAMLDVLTMDDDDPESPTNYKSMDLSHKSAFGSSKAETTDKAHHREPKSTEERNELISTLVESIKQKDSEMRLSSAENNDHNLCVIQPGVITKIADKEPPTVNELESVLTNAIIQKNHKAQEQKELTPTLASAISKQENNLNPARAHDSTANDLHQSNEDKKLEHLKDTVAHSSA